MRDHWADSPKENMYIVKVDDGFVEWRFELDGSDEYSIKDIINFICENTNSSVKSAQLSVQPQSLLARFWAKVIKVLRS